MEQRLFHLASYAPPDLLLAAWEFQLDSIQEEHRHDCYEMMFVTAGCGSCTINGRVYPMIPGDFYVMTPADRHAYAIDGTLRHYNILFSPELFTPEERAVLSEFPRFSAWLTGDEGPKKYSFDAFAAGKLKELLEPLAEELRLRAPGFRAAARGWFLNFLVAVLRNLERTRPLPGSVHDTALSRVINELRRDVTRKPSIRTLAARACVSPTYLGELFHKETGMSITDYWGRVRIDRARIELEKPDRTISEIAQDLGFCDSGHFSRLFRRYTGMTPREYRRLKKP